MRTGLQRHIHSRPRRVLSALPAIGKSRALRVKLAQLSMESLANHVPVTNNHSSDKRIRTHPPPPALSKLKRSQEMPSIRACELRIHTTD
jgi:hypothetical protein